MNTPTQEAMKWLLIQWQSLPRIVIRSFLESLDSSKNSVARKISLYRIAFRKSRQLQQQQLNQQQLQQQLARQQHQQLALHRLQRLRNLFQLRRSQSATRIQSKRIIRFKLEQLQLDHLLWVFLQCVRSDTLKEQKMKHAKMQQNGEMMLLSKFLWWLTTLQNFTLENLPLKVWLEKRSIWNVLTSKFFFEFIRFKQNYQPAQIAVTLVPHLNSFIFEYSAKNWRKWRKSFNFGVKTFHIESICDLIGRWVNSNLIGCIPDPSVNFRFANIISCINE